MLYGIIYLTHKIRIRSSFLTLITMATLLITSCSKYQYSTLCSSLNTDEQGRYFVENNKIKVVYSFAGERGPVSIELLNNSEDGIYVDWSKSSIILNQQNLPYWDENSTINVHTNYSEVVTSGTLYKSKRIDFIPPHSKMQASTKLLSSDFFDLPGDIEKQKTELGGYNAWTFNFTEENSPLKFRSYLTLSTTESFKNPLILDNQFWVGEVIETKALPNMVTYKKPNRYYNESLTSFGKIAVGVGSAVIVLVVLIVNTG